jgi:DNA-binding transcriptional LysR family regulator
MWYDHLIFDASMVARCRSFESALAFVETGLGTAIVPELAIRHQTRPLFDVNLYALPLPPRRTFAILPDHYMTLAGPRALVEALKQVANSISPLEQVRESPPFALKRLRGAAPEARKEPLHAAGR